MLPPVRRYYTSRVKLQAFIARYSSINNELSGRMTLREANEYAMALGAIIEEEAEPREK